MPVTRLSLVLLSSGALLAAAPAAAASPHTAMKAGRAAAQAGLTDVAVGVPAWRSGVGAVDAVRWNGGQALLTWRASGSARASPATASVPPWLRGT